MSPTPHDLSPSIPTIEAGGRRVLLCIPASLGVVALLGVTGREVVQSVLGSGIGFGVLVIFVALIIVRGIAVLDQRSAVGSFSWFPAPVPVLDSAPVHLLKARATID